MSDIKHMRAQYPAQTLHKADLNDNPFQQFKQWFAEARSDGVAEPNAMTLATVDANGQPGCRMMLLKSVDENGFVFFSNYESRKGQALAHNSKAALLFWWVRRQVRVEGVIHKLDAEGSDDYFHQRDRTSQLGAMASAQSRVLQSRDELWQRYQQLESQYADTQELPRPDYWGGYILVPTAFEFWQGQPHRLHDRIAYRLNAQQWEKVRLAP